MRYRPRTDSPTVPAVAVRSLDERPSRLVKETPRFRIEANALGRRVRSLRLAHDWTLEHAAERMQLDFKHLQKIEAGQINVTLATLVRLSQGLGEPISELFMREARRKAQQDL